MSFGTSLCSLQTMPNAGAAEFLQPGIGHSCRRREDRSPEDLTSARGLPAAVLNVPRAPTPPVPNASDKTASILCCANASTSDETWVRKDRTIEARSLVSM